MKDGVLKPFIKTGVIGHPIAHSKSPLIHNHWIAEHGLFGSYRALDIPPEDLAEALPQLLRTDGYTGFNLTLPHKEIAMEIIDHYEPIAKAVGAVNTVWLDDHDRICGTNTDAFGFLSNLGQLNPQSAMVLGAGGAARAIIYGLLEAGVSQVHLTNRTREKAEAIAADDVRIQVVDWEDRSEALAGIALLVNTTSLGMAGTPPLEIDLSALPLDATVSDIVYAPLMTDILAAAQARGNAIVTGIGMLLHQARPAFEQWYGVLPDVTPELEALVLSE